MLIYTFFIHKCLGNKHGELKILFQNVIGHFTNSSRLSYSLLNWVVIAIVLLKLILYSYRLWQFVSLLELNLLFNIFTIRSFNKSFRAKSREKEGKKHRNVTLISPLDFYQAAIINYNNYFFFFPLRVLISDSIDKAIKQIQLSKFKHHKSCIMH